MVINKLPSLIKREGVSNPPPIFFNYNLAKASEYYQLDSLHSNATWHVDHFGFSTLTGKFTEIDGKIFIDENNINNCSLNVSINTNSLSTGVKKFDEHLLSSDYEHMSI